MREGLQETIKVSMISYNHPIEWLQRAYPGRYFHVEVGGPALLERIDEVHRVYPGAMLHAEAQRGRPVGMLAAEYVSEADMLRGLEALAALGVITHNPHQWLVDVEVERARERKAITDPQGLLNPGKLPGISDASNALMAVRSA